MEISRQAIKHNAKNQMQAAKPHACVVALIYILLINALAYLSQSILGNNYIMDTFRSMAGLPGSVAGGSLLQVYPRFTFIGSLLSLALLVLSGTISVGFTIYALNVCRLREAGIATLFDGFTIFLKALWLSILTGIFVFLWSLLFVIPGIIAAYRYRLALYILIDNPHMSVMDCIRESKRMMCGRKGELFVLDLSFIGWSLLTVIPFVSVWVAPYQEITYANYYQALLGLENCNSDANSASFDRDENPPWEL